MSSLFSRLRRRSALGVALIFVLTSMFALSFTLLHPATSYAKQVKGAVYTTVDETVDGTGHCQNGNPDVNCNIYDGKQYVWLNGGPTAGQIGDGTYFFAVLVPSAQGDPNDGAAGNLSFPNDAYTNRTFTISGSTVSYSGDGISTPHDFDSANNKIRLMPYDDTTNPGGVYIMAICSLADANPANGTPGVNPSDCKYDAFKVSEQQVVPGIPLTITKDASGAYKNTFTWTIAKAVDKTVVKQIGGNATFNYTVTVTHDGGTISNVTVTGTIQVFNPNVDISNATVPVTIDGVTDQLSDGTVCTVTNGGSQTLTAAQTDFAYTCALSALPQGELDNTATVNWSQQVLNNGALLDAGPANFTFNNISFTGMNVDTCVNVTDSYAGSLGTACVGDANPSSFTYARSIQVPQFGCQSYDNTATFTTNNTGATGSASQTVTVCGPAKTGALTMGFWKNTNGNSLIANYCAPSGKPSLATYLSGLGAGAGPFLDAAGKSCSQLVTYVNGILNGASATNMNKMLKAQMLATALDVYFSNPNLGYTTTSSGKIKPPSNFLPGTSIGSFVMDLTAICPMVDNLSTGTATCQNNTPSTDGNAAGAFPWASRSVQGILDFAATVDTSPWLNGAFTGNATNSTWYGTDRTKQEILKNVFDQINNQEAFAP